MSHSPIFNDEIFDGKKYEIAINLHYRKIYNEDGEAIPRYLKFDLISMSEDYYKYAQSYNNQLPVNNDDFMDLFQNGLMEPLPIYSNINGGLGLFAGQYISRDSIYFE